MFVCYNAIIWIYHRELEFDCILTNCILLNYFMLSYIDFNFRGNPQIQSVKYDVKQLDYIDWGLIV